MLPLSYIPATPYVEKLSIGAGRRALAISLAILIPALMLLLLLFYGLETPPDFREPRVTMVSLEATEISEAAAEPSSAAREPTPEQPAAPQPASEAPPPPQPAEPLPPVILQPQAAPTITAPSERPPPPRPSVRPPGGAVYGPPNTGGSPSSRDTERVGTAPNGEPLYAASWYTEPGEDELRGYLSTASGPGWSLIACRTAPDYRVEDCVGLDEYPTGSQITRAVLAAAWGFRVRPPRRGGRPMVGAWVRIRIDYGISRR